MCILLVCAFLTIAAHAQEMRLLSQFPSTSQNLSIAFDALGDGRLIAWDGSSIWFQSNPGVDGFTPFLQGIEGDPAFVRVSPDNDTIALGAGGSAGDLYAGEVLTFTLSGTGMTAVLTNTDNHHWADFLNDTLLLVARHDPDAPSVDELIAIDTTATSGTPARVLTGAPDPISSFVVDRNGGEVFVGLATGEIRVFSRTALSNAASAEPIAWESGTRLTGVYDNGGPSALSENGLLAIGGDAGRLTLLNKDNLRTIRTLDPVGAGTGSYVAGYGATRNEFFALHRLGAAFTLYAFDAPANCFLNSFDVKTPVHRSTHFANNAAGGVILRLTAESNCLDDIAKVDYFVRVPGEIRAELLGSTSTPPFVLDTTIFGPSQDQELTFIAEATPISEDAEPRTDEIRVTLSSADAGPDADNNGLPDAPYATLVRPGDRWMSGQTFDGAQFPMVSSVSTLYGFDPDTDVNDPDYDPADDEHGFNDIRVELVSREEPNQHVIVTASEFLLRDDEIGMLIVQVGSDLISLLGTAQAEVTGPEPRGNLEGDGVYVQVGFLVSDNGGVSFSEISGSRLSANPIQLVITGQPLAESLDYALRIHPSFAADGASGIQVFGETGSWRTLSRQTVNPDTGNFTAELTTLGVIAPFAVVDDGGFQPGGGWQNLLAVLYAGLVLLGLADDSGSGGPCFIATAAYGTPLAPEIEVLRTFRDEWLLSSPWGTAAVDTYYRISPGVADRVAASPALASLVRTVLVPCIVGVNLFMYAPWPSFIAGASMLLAALVLARRLRAGRAARLRCRFW